MSTLVAAKQLFRKLIRQAPRPLQNAAVKSWEIAPGETVTTPRAFFLPNQLERVTGWEFATEHPRREMEGGLVVNHAPTRGFLLENAWLIDGSLYAKKACSFLRPPLSRWPRLRVEREIARGAVYCTYAGNRWFGQWLMDDCATYPLACTEGVPITTNQPISQHAKAYEDRLGMKPESVDGAFFRELVIFEDIGQNRHKHGRFRALCDRLLSQVEVKLHPGVFIVRGGAGDRRLLRNELELAESLRTKRGFRILDPMTVDLATIIAVCAGARIVIGVEGSALMHGLMVLAPGAAILALQPPNRFVGLYKHLADRDGQYFGFVVGCADGDDFRIDLTEVERTLDLFPA